MPKSQTRKKKWWALRHKICSSMLQWALQVPKAELKGMWQLLIGYRNSQKKKMHPLGCMTYILSVEHGMKETVAPRGGKSKENKCMWQHSEKYDRELEKCRDLLIPVIKAEFWCSIIPPKFNCSCTEQTIHQLPILSWLKSISPPKEDVKLPSSLKERQYKKYLLAENNI